MVKGKGAKPAALSVSSAAAQPASRWCVQHKSGWCASHPNRAHKDDAPHVETKCGYVVTFPWGCERRAPDCPECIEAIADRSDSEDRTEAEGEAHND